MRKVVLLCLLVFSIALHAQEHSENNTMENQHHGKPLQKWD